MNNNDLVSQIGLENISEEQRQEMNASLGARLEEVMMDTVVGEMSDVQFEEFKNAIAEGGEKMEERIAIVTSQVPGLKEKIDEAIDLELKAIKLLYQSIA